MQSIFGTHLSKGQSWEDVRCQHTHLWHPDISEKWPLKMNTFLPPNDFTNLQICQPASIICKSTSGSSSSVNYEKRIACVFPQLRQLWESQACVQTDSDICCFRSSIYLYNIHAKNPEMEKRMMQLYCIDCIDVKLLCSGGINRESGVAFDVVLQEMKTFLNWCRQLGNRRKMKCECGGFDTNRYR